MLTLSDFSTNRALSLFCMQPNDTIPSVQRRNPTVYILKCIAVLLITWSHMDALVPVSQMCAGGAFGDGLFLFCSGFTLFMGRGGDFFNWYKRRINRIYPSILAWAVVSCLLFGQNHDIITILLYGGGTFISAIMLFYVMLFFLRKMTMKQIGWFCGAYILFLIVLYMFHDRTTVFMYHTTERYTFLHYFLCMVFGAVVGARSSSLGKPRFLPSMAGVLVSAACYFCFITLCRRSPALCNLQILSLIPFWGVLWFMFRMCSAPALIKVYEKPVIRKCVYWISAVSLEVYLVQFALFTDRYNHLFPLNVIVTFIVIFILSYVVKCLGAFIAQTFKDQDYDWKKIFSL